MSEARWGGCVPPAHVSAAADTTQVLLQYYRSSNTEHRVILKIVTKYLTLVKKSERVRQPSQRSNVILKIIHLIYLTYMCVACVNHFTHSSNVLD